MIDEIMGWFAEVLIFDLRLKNENWRLKICDLWLKIENYCLYSYDEESVSARVSEEILNYIPLPPSKGELCERRKLRRDKSRLYGEDWDFWFEIKDEIIFK